MQNELGFKRKATFTEQREAHMMWIDKSDLLLAELSTPSEGRSMIIQRALDKPDLALPFTPIILIKGRRFKRKFGKIVKGLIESGKVVYFEYGKIEEVINNWQNLLELKTLT